MNRAEFGEGEGMSEWKETKVADLCELIVDCVNRTAPVVDYPTPFKMIRTTNIRDGKIDTNQVRCVTEETYNIWVRRGRPVIDDIILTREAPVGEVGRVTKDESIFLGQRTMMYRADKTLADPHFLFYAFLTPNLKDQMLSTGMGSVVEHIRVPDAKEFLIKHPPLPEQKAIAAILSSLDDKIDLLHRQNKTLESIAETLFRQWFVEDVGEGETDREEKRLGEFISIKHGYAFKGEFISPDKSQQILVTPGNFKIGGGFKSGKMKYYNDSDFPLSYILERDDLVITMTDLSKEGDTLGYPALIPEADPEVYLHNQRIGKVIFSLNLSKYFLYFLMKTDDYQWYVLGTSSGTSVRHTSPTSICNYLFLMPSKDVMNEFDILAGVLLKKAAKNQSQVQTLEKLRDTLLPKLMSGEVRVEL
jgi:type I restriction enzyme, S subunit